MKQTKQNGIIRIRNNFYKLGIYQPIIYKMNKAQNEILGLFFIPNEYIDTPLFKLSNELNQYELKRIFLNVLADFKRKGKKIKFNDIRPSYLRKAKTKTTNKNYKLPIGLFSDINKGFTPKIKPKNYKLNKRLWLKSNFSNKIKEVF